MNANLGITLNLDFSAAEVGTDDDEATTYTFKNNVEYGLSVASAVWCLNIPGTPTLSGPGYWNSDNQISVPGMTGYFTVSGNVLTKGGT